MLELYLTGKIDSQKAKQLKSESECFRKKCEYRQYMCSFFFVLWVNSCVSEIGEQ